MPLFRPLAVVLGIVLIILASLMLVPLTLTLFGDKVNQGAFLYSSLISLVSGVLIWAFGKSHTGTLRPREMFLITSGCWVGIPLFAQLPFLMLETPLSFTDALFETISGLTTTGSTIMSGLDHTSRDVLLWRSLLQWLGGIGIIGMAVAILPFLKVGGMKLFQTESSDWSDKVTPQAHVMLKGIVLSYFVLSIGCGLAYYFGGMSAFDAINHAMTTVSTGGFSTYDQSFGHFQSATLHWLSVLFMFLASIPFLHYVRFATHARFQVFMDSQILSLALVLAGSTLILAADLTYNHTLDFWHALTLSALNVTSVVSTTGFASSDYSQWGHAAVVIFFFLTFVGGCSGSTSGGVKIFRFQLFIIMLKDQLTRSVHPTAITAPKYNGRRVQDDVLVSTITFLFFFISTLIVLTFLLSLTGLDLITSLTGATTALMNVGPGLGDIIGPAGNFASLSDFAKWLLSAGMILGRLEFLAILILFTRTFWRG
ncbi:MAG: TrkH family potassium uptake protein [Hahellaceae bacterium]|nr:TrkH family potassium uptake protein [Hahellaceae bacterium]MCP5169252.1 TrkH family potassium uptake protein [Hahellaceae bacterium]